MVKIVRSKGDGEEGGGGGGGSSRKGALGEKDCMGFATWEALDLASHSHNGGGVEEPRGIQEGEGRVE